MTNVDIPLMIYFIENAEVRDRYRNHSAARAYLKELDRIRLFRKDGSDQQMSEVVIDDQ
jgi:hypothetical protein